MYPSLADLAVQSMRGDEAAFEDLHRRLHVQVYRFFTKRGFAKEADHLAQETWVQIWSAFKKKTYDPIRGAFDLYLLGVARMVLRRHRHSLGRSLARRTLADGDSIVEESDPERDPAEIHHEKWRLSTLRRCYRSALNEDERQLLTRLLHDEVSERALSEQLGVPRSTLHDKKQQCYRKLQQCFAATMKSLPKKTSGRSTKRLDIVRSEP